ncbi:MAG: hypothetical protein DRJ01_07135 [Bacteroidetes bacterium]|nr:MAG: hypothetical protein DRJ01_07135 [Bacteroidota bacterium]
MNKFIIFFLAFLFGIAFVSAQTITDAEYFIDNDTGGVGTGTAITLTQGDSVNPTFDFSLQGIKSGFHNLFIRVKDDSSHWSLYKGARFYVYDTTHYNNAIVSPKIKYAEYFIDDDPGLGNGVVITFSQADSVEVQFAISLSGISSGFHTLFIRSINTDNTWGICNKQRFYVYDTTHYDLAKVQPQIIAAEYIFDDDSIPVGQGIPISIISGDQIDDTVNISIAGLDEGFHLISIRTKDVANKWGLTKKDTFYVYDCTNTVSSFPYNENFETTSNGWTAGGDTSSWQWGIPANTLINSAASGSKAWVTNLTGDNNQYEQSYVYSPCFDFSNMNLPVVNFKLFYETGYYSGVALQYSIDGGGHWQHVGAYNDNETWYNGSYISGLGFSGNYEGWNGSSNGWVTVTHPMSNLAGLSNVRLRLVFGASYYVSEGVAFDDFNISDFKQDVALDAWVSPITSNCGFGEEEEITVRIKNVGTTDENNFTLAYSVDSGRTYVAKNITIPTIKPGDTYDYTFEKKANLAKIKTYHCIAFGTFRDDEDASNDTLKIDIFNNKMLLSTSTVNTNCGSSNGSATVSIVSGGTSPYSYAWSTGDSNATIDSLSSGVYVVTVTDANECKEFTIATISDIGGPEIDTSSVTDVSCNGNNNGAIDINVAGGQTPYNYTWSNGAVTQDISGLYAGPYEVSVSDNADCLAIKSIYVDEPDALSLALSVVKADCGYSNGSATVSVYGGTPPYVYNWSTGGILSTESALSYGIYSVTVTDNNDCSVSTSVAISEKEAPEIRVDSIVPSDCGSSNGGIYITVYEGSGTYYYSWSDESTNEDLTGVSSGDYSVTVTDGYGCCAVASATIFADKPDMNPICLVTVDTLTNHNQIVWEKLQTSGISAFNIYKETTHSGKYSLINTWPFDSLSIYEDTLSNPLQRSWRYKLSVIDDCGNESELSPEHKTIHLTINLGLNQSINLIWDQYEGFDFDTYFIYRHSTDGWTKIDSIPNNLTSYTDFNPPEGDLYYQIEVVKPNGCDITKASNKRSSRSNLSTTIDKGSDITNFKRNIDKFDIYPNPNKGVFTLSIQLNLIRDVEVKIFDMKGELIKEKKFHKVTGKVVDEINLNGYSKGLYYIQIITNDENFIKKVVVF